MADGMSDRTFKFLSRFSIYISGLSVTFGAMVLTGWIFHIQRLKGLIPGQVAVKANTAVCFVLIGTALWLAKAGARIRLTRRLSRGLALLASSIGLLSFLECWRGWDLGIDQLLFTAGPDDLPGSVRLGLMSPVAAADFLLLGITIELLNIEGRWSRVLQSVLPTIAGVAATAGVLDFVLDPHKTHTHIAPLTALVLVLFSFALLFARTESGLGALLMSGSVGGFLCRRLLPSAILIPVAIAWLRWKGQQIGLYSDWTGLAVMTISAAVLLAGLTVWTAVVLNRIEERRKQAEESARRLAAIVTSSNDGIIGKTLDGTVTSWNPGAEAIYGYSAEEMVGHPATRVVPPDLVNEFYAFLHRLQRGETIRHHETERIRKDGKRIFVSLSLSPLRDDKAQIIGASTIIRDITDRKQAEQKLGRINQTLQALSACTDSMMRATDESALLQQVCDAVIQVGGYRMAWMGYAEHDQNKNVRPMAHSGTEAGYLLTANITWADGERGQGPTGTAVRTGKAVVSRNFADDSRLQPWRKEAARCGFRSSIALPLRSEDQILGAITIYSAEVDAFDSREQQLLEQLASNLSYAIMTLRAREQRDRSEQKLRESALYARNLLEASLDPLVTISKEGKITDVNEATEKATGISRERLISSDFSDYFTEPQKARDGYQLVFEKGFVRDFPLAIRSASGNVMEVLYNATLFRSVSGKVEGVFAAARDVTELKRSEQELRLSRERLKLALKAGHAGTFDWNIQNNVNLWSPEVEEVHGLAQGEFGGKFEDWEALVVPDDLPAAKACIETSLNSGEFAGEWRIHRRNDGQVRWITARAKVIFDDAGRPNRMIGLNMDVTERRQAEQEVRKLNEELEERVAQRTAQLEAANKELEAFTYSVSHDLRAPLRHISGFSKILSEEFSASLPPEAQHHVQRIQEGTRRMGQLVDDLLNLGRVGRKELSLQVAGLRSIVDDVIQSLNPDIGDREVEWKIGELPYVECDTALMHQVWQNLLSNALKFTRPRGHAVIAIGQEQRDGEAVVYVRDNGVGFSMKYADKLFGVFQRLHRAEDFEGTGVGLATVQRVIQKHGGRIWAEAELDKGASFYFTLGNSQLSEANSKAIIAGVHL